MRTPHLLALSISVAGLLSTAALAEKTAAAASSGTFKRLYSERASASSYLRSNWNKYDENYHPNYAVDDDHKTAWVEGVDGNGDGQVLIIPTSDVKRARAVKLTIFNGYQKSKALLDANAAPKDVVVRLRDAAGDEVATKKTTLKKEMGGQDVVVDVPKGKGFSSVEIAVVNTHDGKTYKDGCISDVEVSVDADVAYSAAAEKAKLGALKSWIGDRKSQAKAFASVKPSFPFAATHFSLPKEPSWDNEEVAVWDEAGDKMKMLPGKKALDTQLKEKKGQGAVAKLFSSAELGALNDVEAIAAKKGETVSSTWQRVDVKGSPLLPDGIEELSSFTPAWKSLAPYFDLSSVTFFEAKGEAGGVSRSKPRGNAEENEWIRTWTTTNARVKKRADGSVESVYFAEHRIIEERETSDSHDHYVLDFNPAGQLQRVRRFGSDEHWVSVSLVDIERNADGKVSKLRQRSASGGKAADEYNSGIGTQDVVAVANDTNS